MVRAALLLPSTAQTTIEGDDQGRSRLCWDVDVETTTYPASTSREDYGAGLSEYTPSTGDGDDGIDDASDRAWGVAELK